MPAQTLLNILSSVIHNKEIDVEAAVDWKRVYEEAMEQCVPGTVFCKIKQHYDTFHSPILDIGTKLQWYSALKEIESWNKKANRVLYKVAAALSKNNINFILLKGQGLAFLYPNQYSRNCGDIDIFLGPDKYASAKKVFAENGWLIGCSKYEDFKHQKCLVDGIMIELHIYPILLPKKNCNAYFQKWAIESFDAPMCGFYLNEKGEYDDHGRFITCFPTVQNFVYTFIHAFFHFISEGLVLRQVMDFAMLLKKMNDEKMDHSDVKMYLEKVGFLNAWKVFGCLLVKYLGFMPEMIPAYDAQYEKKADRVMATIWEEGHKGRERKSGKWSEYLRQCSSHFRLFGLFPTECTGFLTRMITNTALKYAKR